MSDLVWSDGWLLYSILHAARGGPATLGQIIEVGDAVNHAIFTADEISGGLERLTRDGYVTIDARKVIPTELSKALGSRARAKTAYEAMENLRRMIGAPDSSPNATSPGANSSIVGFQAEDVKRAYEAYRNDWADMLERLGDNDAQP